MKPALVLASSSRYRRTLLERLQLPFGWDSPDIDETPLPAETIEAMTQRLALAKARAVALRHPHALIIGSDQACQRRGDSSIIGKGGNFDGAFSQLPALAASAPGTMSTVYSSAPSMMTKSRAICRSNSPMTVLAASRPRGSALRCSAACTARTSTVWSACH
jgi:predicted house-cleaning NTP pyrophosphatase (Maf/HAM1 superfamily)